MNYELLKYIQIVLRRRERERSRKYKKVENAVNLGKIFTTSAVLKAREKKILYSQKKRNNLKNYFSQLNSFMFAHHHLIDSFSHHFRYERAILRAKKFFATHYPINK